MAKKKFTQESKLFELPLELVERIDEKSFFKYPKTFTVEDYYSQYEMITGESFRTSIVYETLKIPRIN